MLVSHLMKERTAIKVDSHSEKMRILILLLNSSYLCAYKLHGKLEEFTNYYIIVESESKYNGQYTDVLVRPVNSGLNFIHSSDLYAG